VTIQLPYLIFLGDAQVDLDAKTGFGVRDWRPEACAGHLPRRLQQVRRHS
jgi:hypothetical protein